MTSGPEQLFLVRKVMIVKISISVLQFIFDEQEDAVSQLLLDCLSQLSPILFHSIFYPLFLYLKPKLHMFSRYIHRLSSRPPLKNTIRISI